MSNVIQIGSAANEAPPYLTAHWEGKGRALAAEVAARYAKDKAQGVVVCFSAVDSLIGDLRQVGCAEHWHAELAAFIEHLLEMKAA
ncbi:hypothetical protein [Stenotrophomonas sp.]|uniref:hypothetical protein n=1 Tax=Stenotrophomonas sp. TaxID=69392 RepID=UPI0028AD1ACA|nr:hypothetical protein [Stenotrophomonas sp.]